MSDGYADVKTYLGLCQKYPEARDDLLELRRQKNNALYFLVVLFFLFGGFIGFMVGGIFK